jgi:hypothetical protein
MKTPIVHSTPHECHSEPARNLTPSSGMKLEIPRKLGMTMFENGIKEDR